VLQLIPELREALFAKELKSQYKRRKRHFLFYQALSTLQYRTTVQIEQRFSTIGIARSRDAINFSDRKQLIIPEYSWEEFGCENPKITKFKGKYYIFYTALSTFPFCAKGIKVGLAISKDLKKIQEKYLVTPFNTKAMTLFLEKIKGKI